MIELNPKFFWDNKSIFLMPKKIFLYEKPKMTKKNTIEIFQIPKKTKIWWFFEKNILKKKFSKFLIYQLHNLYYQWGIIGFIPPSSEQFSPKQGGTILAFFKFAIEKKGIFKQNPKKYFPLRRKQAEILKETSGSIWWYPLICMTVKSKIQI